MQKLLFVYNSKAGKGLLKSNLCDIIDVFTKGGYDVTAYPTQAKLDGCRKIMEDGRDYDLIVTSGGDGTLSEAVKALMTFDEKKPLGYIPAGSTNDCANSLNISKKLINAAQEIVDGVYFDYDIGTMNDQTFVYVAGFGAFTDVSYETKQNIKNIFGHAAYLAEGIRRAPKYRGHKMSVWHDGEVTEGDFILGLVSNALSIGGMKNLVSDNVVLDDGLFEVVLCKTPKNPIDFSTTVSNAAFNNLTERNFVTFKASHIVFKCEDELAWTIDGEAGGIHKVVDIKNLKQAIRLKLKSTSITEEQEEFNRSLNDALTQSLMGNIDERYYSADITASEDE